MKLDLSDYQTLDTVKIDDDFIFEKVKFHNGCYGINYVKPSHDINATVLVSIDDYSIGVDTFMDFARRSIHHIDINDADKLELVVIVDQENKDVYKEVINGEQASTLIQKLEISRELIELKNENKFENMFALIIIAGIILTETIIIIILKGGFI